jgi:hypothetical protein
LTQKKQIPEATAGPFGEFHLLGNVMDSWDSFNRFFSLHNLQHAASGRV